MVRISKRIKKQYLLWGEKKRLKEYYRSQGRKPPGARALRNFLICCGLFLIALWRADGLRAAAVNMLIAVTAAAVVLIVANRLEARALEKEVRKKLSRREFNRRLERCSSEEIIGLFRNKILADYPDSELRQTGPDVLEGQLRGEKTAVYYIYPDETGLVENRDILGILRECRQRSVERVRIFTNGNYRDKAYALAERYEVDLLLNDNGKLRKFLEKSELVPTDEEIDALISTELQKRKRRIEILKKEALRQKKTGEYLFYGVVLLLMACFKIGIVVWNLAFAALLFLLAATSRIVSRRTGEEEIL